MVDPFSCLQTYFRINIGQNVFSLKYAVSSYRDMSFGLGFNHLRCGNETPTAENRPLDPSAGLSLGQCIASPAVAEVSALSFRQSYNSVQGPGSTDPKLIPPPRTIVSKPTRLRDKSIRKMKLRPRQILCTKCKQGIHETKVGQTRSTSSDLQSKNENNTQKNDLKSQNNTHRNSQNNTLSSKNSSSENAVTLSLRDLRAEQRKRRLHGINSELEIPLKKLPKPEYLKYCEPAPKPNPVIKISFASPKGEGTVLKIPRKSHTVAETDNDSVSTSISDTTFSVEQSREEYKRLKKALKKARKERPSDDYSSSSPSRHHHKKSKRSKHRLKKKHKHKENEPENVPDKNDAVSECASDAEDQLRSAAVDSYVPKDYGEREDSEWALTPPEFVKEDILTNSSTNSMKESVQDTPYQARLTRTFLRNPDGSSYGLSQRSTSSGNSDRSSIYDENSNSDFNEDESDPLQNVPDSLAPDKDGDDVKLHPLMMRIQTRTVNQCQIPDGRTIGIGDVVWGKIHGFPWWPGKIININVSQGDNGVVISHMAHIAWFGSSTMSNMPCDELFPFLEDYKLRFNKKKRGAYKIAIKQATLTAEAIHTSQGPVKDLEDIDIDFED